MSKRPNLAAIAAAAGSRRRAPEMATVPTALAPTEVAGRAGPRTRIGTKQIAAHFPEDVAWQLRALAVDRKTTVQNLLAEALNDLFAKYGKPEVAPLERERRAS
ncbi:MAG TPA: ribbon-helix-helix domain-containing protein [Pirellulales bacterium]